MSLYHDGSRELQDRFDTRRIADRLEEVNITAVFSDFQRELIDTAPMFWLATADADGFSDVSYAPRAGHTPPVPDWKRRPEYRDHLPARDLARLAADATEEDRT